MLDCGIIHRDILFIYNVKFENLKKDLGRKFVPSIINELTKKNKETSFNESYAFCSKINFINNEGEPDFLYTLIMHNKFKRNSFDYGVLAHEITHITQMIFKELGINRNKEIEFEGYFHGYIMQKALEFIIKCDTEEAKKCTEKLDEYKQNFETKIINNGSL